MCYTTIVYSIYNKDNIQTSKCCYILSNMATFNNSIIYPCVTLVAQGQIKNFMSQMHQESLNKLRLYMYKKYGKQAFIDNNLPFKDIEGLPFSESNQKAS